MRALLPGFLIPLLSGCLSSWEEWALPRGGYFECPEGRAAGEVESQDGMSFAFTCAGTFLMGSPEEEADRAWDEWQHEVTLATSFWIGAYEVTQAQFAALLSYQPSNNAGCDTCPVEDVTWHEAAAFANALSAEADLDSCYVCGGTGSDVECDPSSAWDSPYACPGYRLPTEAEWEMAARAGETWVYSGSDDVDEVAWYDDNTDGTQPVGGLDPNAWGLHDMSGNVWEWTGDWWDDYPNDPVTDPAGPSGGSDRVLRGGSWIDTPADARVAFRYRYDPAYRIAFVGFRLARSYP